MRCQVTLHPDLLEYMTPEQLESHTTRSLVDEISKKILEQNLMEKEEHMDNFGNKVVCTLVNVMVKDEKE